MTRQSAKPSFINHSARCTYLFPNGRRCRLYAAANPSFCPAHAPLPANQSDAAEIASTLTVNLDDFTSAAQINDFLSRLLLLLAQDKISTRRARSPCLHHQPAPPHPPRHRQRRKRRAHPNHLRHARPRTRPRHSRSKLCPTPRHGLAKPRRAPHHNPRGGPHMTSASYSRDMLTNRFFGGRRMPAREEAVTSWRQTRRLIRALSRSFARLRRLADVPGGPWVDCHGRPPGLTPQVAPESGHLEC